MNGVPSLDTLPADLTGRRALVRVDLNVPMQNGKVSDRTRIARVASTLKQLAARGARVIILSHFGRPQGKPVADMSLDLVRADLADALGAPVAFASDCVGPIAESAITLLQPGGYLLLENLRFHAGEEKNAPEFLMQLARLGDFYVNDAFSCAHRAHASTAGLAAHLPAYAGRLMQEELHYLHEALVAPERPVAAVVGGSKVSTKIELLQNLVGKVDLLVIGGGMANTFLHAGGIRIGASLCEKEMVETVKAIRDRADRAGCTILLPRDVVVAEEFKAFVPSHRRAVGEIGVAEMVLDIGPFSVDDLLARLSRCRTIVWNGPLGAFEYPPFDTGTVQLAKGVARLTRERGVVSIAGGGDTVSALAHAGVIDAFTYVSTAGGAFLEWLEGKALPGVTCLDQKRAA